MPSVFKGHTTGKKKLERYNRVKKRRLQQESLSAHVQDDDERTSEEPAQENEEMKILKDDIMTLTSKVDELEREKEAIAKELKMMKEKLEYHQIACRMTVEAIKNDDVRTKFYTGLSTWYLFGVLFHLL